MRGVVLESEDMQIGVGGQVILNCMVVGDMDASLEWYVYLQRISTRTYNIAFCIVFCPRFDLQNYRFQSMQAGLL